jgi:hypothetical protein
MVAMFPELRRVRGHVHTAAGGRHPHWWCVTPAGEIIDPTVTQFVDAVLDYEPHDDSTPEPVGKCLNCGDYVHAPRSSGCSDECERELERYYAIR